MQEAAGKWPALRQEFPHVDLHLIGPLPLAVMLVMLLHLVGGAVGMALLGRAFGLRREATLVAGLAWALSGSFASTSRSIFRLLSDSSMKSMSSET